MSADRTPFAGLERLDPGDVLDVAFLRDNPSIIDKLLEIGAVTHRHDGHAALAPPAVEPTASVDATGGQLPSDASIDLAFTWLDALGGETIPSPAVNVDTNASLEAPTDAPVAADVDHSAGTLVADTYYYAVTIIDSYGGETPLGPIIQVTVDPGYANSQIPLSGLTDLVDEVGGTAWRLWRSVGTGDWALLSQGAGDTFTDDGSFAADSSVAPPDDSTGTNSTAFLHVTVPGPAPSGAVSFRLYATYDGSFDDPALVAQYPLDQLGVEQTFSALDLLDGSPPVTPTAIAGANKIDPDNDMLDFPWKRPVATAADLPSAGNTEGDIRESLDDRVLHGWDGAAWVSLGGGGGGGGHTIADEEAPLPSRGVLDFVGAGVTATDDGADDRTVVTIPGFDLATVWQDDWDAATAYTTGELLRRNGSSWLAVADSTGVDPSTDDGTHWQLVAEEGAVGPAGPVGMVWRGPWSAVTAYVTRDGVLRNGSAWIAVADNTNVDPSADDGTHWQEVASKGDTGATGATGDPGPTGPTPDLPFGVSWIDTFDHLIDPITGIQMWDVVEGNYTLDGTTHKLKESADGLFTRMLTKIGRHGEVDTPSDLIDRRVTLRYENPNPLQFDSPVYRGVWDVGTTYHLGDMVEIDGSPTWAAFMAVATTTGDDPTIDSGTHWVSAHRWGVILKAWHNDVDDNYLAVVWDPVGLSLWYVRAGVREVIEAPGIGAPSGNLYESAVGWIRAQIRGNDVILEWFPDVYGGVEYGDPLAGGAAGTSLAVTLDSPAADEVGMDAGGPSGIILLDPHSDQVWDNFILEVPGAAGIAGPQGVTGDVGPTGDTGPVGLTWLGAWSAVTAYVTRDAVQRNGSAWYAVADSTNVDPSTDDGTHWSLLASKGDTGAAGAAGAAGPAGLTWLGAWSAATAYVLRDAVLRNGSAWYAVAGSTNVDPATDDGTHWSLLASKGDTGATGATGAAGAAGATGPAGPVIARETVDVTAAALASGAGANVSPAIYKGYRILKVAANRPCRVRIYPTAAYRTADVDRPVGTDPTGDHGCLFDSVLTSGVLSLALAPVAHGYNLDGPVTTSSYFRITNNDSVTGDVTVTLTLAQVE